MPIRSIWFAAAVVACATPERNAKPKVAISPPTELCRDKSLSSESFCLDAPWIERLMKSDNYLVADVDQPGRGTTDIKVVTYEVPENGKKIRFRAKWKSAAPNGEGFNNSPRKELAAYELQKLFLSQDEYVVPPTTMRCVPIDRFVTAYRAKDPKPTFEHTKCVLGLVTYWMEHVTDKDILRSQRYQTDAEYRTAISELNLLTYLIDHRDVHDGNFLISTDPDHPRAFSVDNGLAFSGLRNPLPILKGEPNWSHIIVPSLPREKIQKLRQITRAELDRSLATVLQLARRGDLLVTVDSEPPFEDDEDEGVRQRDGIIQLGLTKSEIDGVEERIHELVNKVDENEIALF